MKRHMASLALILFIGGCATKPINMASVPAIPESRVSSTPLSLKAQLVGTWRVMKFADTDPTGKTTYPFGEQPAGYFVYDSTGHLSIQIMRTPATQGFASGKDNQGTDSEVRSAYDGYVAYFGTYHVDENNSVVTHVVEGSLHPSYTGTDQSRPFKIDGDDLIIELRGDGNHYYRQLRRVR